MNCNMRTKPTDFVEDHRVDGPRGCNSGAFIFKKGAAHLRVIVSDGLGWDHVSVSLPTRCPTWEEMCYIKSLFFEDEERVMQLHPEKSKWINNHPFCLHLWRPQTKEEIEQRKSDWGEEWIYGDIDPAGEIPLPPSHTVGLQELNP